VVVVVVGEGDGGNVPAREGGRRSVALAMYGFAWIWRKGGRDVDGGFSGEMWSGRFPVVKYSFGEGEVDEEDERFEKKFDGAMFTQVVP
jgi:hypothetical protein